MLMSKDATPVNDTLNDVGTAHANSSTERTVLRIWLSLLACNKLMESHLRPKLRNDFESTLARFDLMSQLERYPNGLKMQDLSRLLMVTRGNMTGLTDRMVSENLIERRDDPKDRRSQYVQLTRKGRALFKKMAAQHMQWVTELLGDINQMELQQLSDSLTRLKRHLSVHT